MNPRFLLATAVAVGLHAGSADAAGVSGSVLSVDAGAGRLTVSAAEGNKGVVLLVSPQTRITTDRGHPLRLTDLKPGDAVGVTTRGASALSVVVTTVRLSGTVATVDPAGGTFVVTKAGSSRGVTVTVNARTPIVSATGASLALSSLKPGDDVAVTYLGTGVTQVVVNTKPHKLVGRIKSAPAGAKSIVVTDVGSGTDVVVTVTTQTIVVNNQQAPRALNALTRGLPVAVTLVAGVASKIEVNPK